MVPEQIQTCKLQEEKAQTLLQLTLKYTWPFWRCALELTDHKGKYLDLVHRWIGFGTGHKLTVAVLYSHSRMALNEELGLPLHGGQSEVCLEDKRFVEASLGASVLSNNCEQTIATTIVQ